MDQKPYSDEFKKEVIEAKLGGLTTMATAQKYNISYNTVFMWVKQHLGGNVKKKKKPKDSQKTIEVKNINTDRLIKDALKAILKKDEKLQNDFALKASLYLMDQGKL